MEIKILQLIDGAKKARGLTVVIDVFRAFSLESYLFSLGAKTVIPVGDKEIAYRMKDEHPDYILAGERHGKILPNFDTGNSPSRLVGLEIEGKTVIHTTSAGTQGVTNAVHADEILGAALVNAKATAEYIRKKNPETVSLVCMGLEALREAEEDTLCARYIESLLLEKPLDLQAEIERLRYGAGAHFFDEKQQDVFPEADFYACVKADIFPFAIRYDKQTGQMTKVQTL